MEAGESHAIGQMHFALRSNDGGRHAGAGEDVLLTTTADRSRERSAPTLHILTGIGAKDGSTGVKTSLEDSFRTASKNLSAGGRATSVSLHIHGTRGGNNGVGSATCHIPGTTCADVDIVGNTTRLDVLDANCLPP